MIKVFEVENRKSKTLVYHRYKCSVNPVYHSPPILYSKYVEFSLPPVALHTLSICCSSSQNLTPYRAGKSERRPSCNTYCQSPNAQKHSRDKPPLNGVHSVRSFRPALILSWSVRRYSSMLGVPVWWVLC
jgi:hypothetical protein